MANISTYQQLSIFLSSQNKLFHLYFFPSSIFFPPFFTFPFSCQPFCSLVLTNPLSSVALTSKEWGSLILKSRSKKALRHKSVLAVQGRKQGQKNLGSRVALLSRKFLRFQKVFARITERNLLNCPNTFKQSGFFQMISNFPDGFKTVRIFPDVCQFSGRFQNCPDFSRWLPIFQVFFQNCPDFSRWLPIFQIISKLSGFSRW